MPQLLPSRCSPLACTVLFLFLTFQTCQSAPSLSCFLEFTLSWYIQVSIKHVLPLTWRVLTLLPCLFSGSLWSSVAWQVLHCVAKAIFYYDAVNRGLRHPQLLPYRPLRLAVLPEVHHPLPLPHVVLLGLLADTGGAWPSPGSTAGFCGGRQAADCSGGRRDTLVAP